jgi:UrcA family protein
MTACASLALLATPASADRVNFTYNTDELRTIGGVNAVYKRIGDHSEALCREINVQPLVRHKACVADLVDDFVASIDHPKLAAVHETARSEAQYASR